MLESTAPSRRERSSRGNQELEIGDRPGLNSARLLFDRAAPFEQSPEKASMGEDAYGAKEVARKLRPDRFR
jgi:hypothetical protein